MSEPAIADQRSSNPPCFVLHWSMPNGHFGHGVLMYGERFAEYCRYVEDQNLRYGADTHWLAEPSGKRLFP